MYKEITNEMIECAIVCGEMGRGISYDDARRGYCITNFNDTGVWVLEPVYDDDVRDYVKAVRDAEETGYCKIIPINELPDDFCLKYTCYGWCIIDTPKNRENIKTCEILKLKNER